MGEQPQDAPDQPAFGTLVVNVNRYGSPRRSKVNVMVDGVRMVNAEGPNAFTLPPGRHMVSCEVNADGRTFGQADMALDLGPGQVTHVFFTGPAGLNAPGVLAYQPVGHPGRATRLACLLPALIICLGSVALIIGLAIFMTRR